jgi:hypothetical protein
MTARRVLRRLVDVGLLEPATDLDYSKERMQAYAMGDALIPLRRVAIRSRAFDFVPPPPPERLSEMLAATEPCILVSSGWYTLSTGEPMPRKDEPGTIKVVVQQYEPARAWVFASADDRAPEVLSERRAASDWTHDSFRSGHTEQVGFPLDRYDDLGLLR